MMISYFLLRPVAFFLPSYAYHIPALSTLLRVPLSTLLRVPHTRPQYPPTRIKVPRSVPTWGSMPVPDIA
eukprot:1726037-Rhodomonas_salina.1